MHLFDIISGVKRKAAEKLGRLRGHADGCGEGGGAPLPVTLNLMVNDICNSRCVMCNVWKRKREREITPSELAAILEDPLFDRLTSVGVSGGEPTLRKDLPEIFGVITRKKGIRGVSLITNGLKADAVIARVEKCYGVCKDAGVNFSLMVSLDGVGPVHDIVRGREGAFENALRVIRHFRDNTDIPLSVACTVVKENVWRLDEVLDFCKEEKVYGRFRVAEFIDRLYNADLAQSIRNFDEDERYQIALFFSKLELTYEKDPNIKATYRNIRRMVFEGMDRESGCPYRSVAVGLSAGGGLIFCSPKSPLLGSCLDVSAMKLYEDNIGVRQEIIKAHCAGCIHDYHAPASRGLLKEAEEEARFRAMFSVKMALKDARKVPSAIQAELDLSRLAAPLIVGWYGTETAGDKAILGEIISRLGAGGNTPRITVASLYPLITKRTLRELGVDAAIVKTFSAEYLKACENADGVIMGGGPLMGMEPLGFVLEAFLTARRNNIPTIVEGCGIGPLSEKAHISAVKEILRLSTTIRVRDTASLAWAVENTGRRDAVCGGDPAVDFVERWKKENPATPAPVREDYMALFLREITTEYANGMGPEEFAAFKKNFEDGLGRMVCYLMERTGLRPLFMPMHTFTVGNDDRDFMRRFVKTYLNGHEYELGDRVYSPQDILSAMSRSRFNLCMRFHSVLFADTLGAPLVAVDYTGGGKIKGYLKDRQREHLMIDRAELAGGRWRKAVDNALPKVSSGGF